MKHDYTKWSLGCLVREVGRNLPEEIGLKQEGSFCNLTSQAAHITDVVSEDGEITRFRYRAQWLLSHFLRIVRHNTPELAVGPAYDELKRRLEEDQKERGVFETAT